MDLGVFGASRTPHVKSLGSHELELQYPDRMQRLPSRLACFGFDSTRWGLGLPASSDRHVLPLCCFLCSPQCVATVSGETLQRWPRSTAALQSTALTTTAGAVETAEAAARRAWVPRAQPKPAATSLPKTVPLLRVTWTSPHREPFSVRGCLSEIPAPAGTWPTDRGTGGVDRSLRRYLAGLRASRASAAAASGAVISAGLTPRTLLGPGGAAQLAWPAAERA